MVEVEDEALQEAGAVLATEEDAEVAEVRVQDWTTAGRDSY